MSVLLWNHQRKIEITITSFILRDFSHGNHETYLSLSRKSNTGIFCAPKNENSSKTSNFFHALSSSSDCSWKIPFGFFYSFTQNITFQIQFYYNYYIDETFTVLTKSSQYPGPSCISWCWPSVARSAGSSPPPSRPAPPACWGGDSTGWDCLQRTWRARSSSV